MPTRKLQVYIYIYAQNYWPQVKVKIKGWPLGRWASYGSQARTFSGYRPGSNWWTHWGPLNCSGPKTQLIIIKCKKLPGEEPKGQGLKVRPRKVQRTG